MPTVVDLTPFGFTPTESLAYGTLCDLGPLGGYALARSLSIARANAYQALHGLVAKGAAKSAGEHPTRFRAVQPVALFSSIVERRAEELDRLERQLEHLGAGAAPGTVPILAHRGLLDLCLRTAARVTAPLICVAPPSVLSALLPAWHKRAADRVETRLWSLGADALSGLPVPLSGTVEPSLSQQYFGCLIVGMVAGTNALIARTGEPFPGGIWTTDEAVVGAIHAAVDHLTTEVSGRQD